MELTVKKSEITPIKMRENPPKSIMFSGGMRVIHKDFCYEWVGIGWIKLALATEEDRKTVPVLVEG